MPEFQLVAHHEFGFGQNARVELEVYVSFMLGTNLDQVSVGSLGASQGCESTPIGHQLARVPFISRAHDGGARVSLYLELLAIASPDGRPTELDVHRDDAVLPDTHDSCS